MATDRGGLRYSIFLQDKFSTTSKKFRTEMAQNRKAFAAFRGDLKASRSDAASFRKEVGSLGQDLGKLQTVRDRAAAKQGSARELADQRRLNVLAKERAATDTATARRIQAIARQRTAQEREHAKIRKAMLADEKKIESSRKRSLVHQRALTKSAKDTGSAVNRISFTFRRLFGILAAFAAARAATGGFVGLIKGAVAFNQEVEDSQLSLASLFVTAGQVRNEQGKLVQGAEAFAIAQAEATRQSALLRQDSLKTVATFGELLTAFQAGVGPGLEAGLKLDEIREVTIRISQAAAAMALPQNQLIEEIRSLLRGTIQPRTTLIASVLGIRSEDITRVKEAGTLFEFLQNRLKGFALAAEATQNTFSGLAARLKDAFLFTGGEAALSFFVELKVLLRSIFESLVVIKKNAAGVTESITPSPEAVKTFRGLFDGLENLIKGVREGLKGVDFGPLLGGIGETIGAFGDLDFGKIFTAAAQVAGVIGKVLAAMLKIVGFLVDIFAPLAGVLTIFGSVIALVLQFRLIMVVVSFVIKEITVTARLLPAIFAKAAAAAGGLRAALRGASNIIGPIGTGIALAGLTASTLLSIFGDIEVSAEEGARLMSTSFVDALDEAITKARQLAVRLAEASTLDGSLVDPDGKSFTEMGVDAASNWTTAFLSSVVGLVSKDGAKILQSAISDQMLEDDAIRERLGKLSAADREVLRLEQERAARRKKFEKDVSDSIDGVADRRAAAAKREADLEKWLRGIVEGRDDDKLVTIKERIKLLQDEIAIQRKLDETTLQSKILNLDERRVDTATKARVEGEARIAQLNREATEVEKLFKLQTEALLEKRPGNASQAAAQTQQLQALDNQRLIALGLIGNKIKEQGQAIRAAREELERTVAARQLELSLVDIRLSAEMQVASINATNASDREKAIVAARAQFAQLQQEVALRRQLLALDIQRAQAAVAISPAGSARDAAEERLNQLVRERNQLTDSTNIKLMEQAEILRRLVLEESGTALQGLQAGLLEFGQEFSSAFLAGVEVMKSALSAFASFISDSIVDAFDPTTDTDLLERFGRFLQELARMIIQKLVEIAIAKAVLAAFGGGAGFSQGGEVQGLAAGGAIPSANGDVPRPRGLHPSDKTPIWAAEGEFMHRVAAVKKYGMDVMEKINRGLIDPAALRALAGVGTMRRMKGRSGGAGYAAGGAIAEVRKATAPSVAAAPPASREASPTQPVTLFFGEQEMDRALAAGAGRAMLRFLRENNYKPN